MSFHVTRVDTVAHSTGSSNNRDYPAVSPRSRRYEVAAIIAWRLYILHDEPPKSANAWSIEKK